MWFFLIEGLIGAGVIFVVGCVIAAIGGFIFGGTRSWRELIK